MRVGPHVKYSLLLSEFKENWIAFLENSSNVLPFICENEGGGKEKYGQANKKILAYR
jgi:hypothetical protein